MNVKRIEYRGHKYWVDSKGLAYRDLLHAILGVASPSPGVVPNTLFNKALSLSISMCLRVI